MINTPASKIKANGALFNSNIPSPTNPITRKTVPVILMRRFRRDLIASGLLLFMKLIVPNKISP